MVAFGHPFQHLSLEFGDPPRDLGEVERRHLAILDDLDAIDVGVADGARGRLADCLRSRLYARIAV